MKLASTMAGFTGWNRKSSLPVPTIYTNYAFIDSNLSDRVKHPHTYMISARPLDTLTTFSKLKGSGSTPVRYAIRQVLQQEYEKEILRQRSQAGQARLNGPQRDNFSRDDNNCKENTNPDGPNPLNFSSRMNGPKRDFFGRVIVNEARPGSCVVSDDVAASPSVKAMNNPVWVGFHEGYSNAVRKRVTLNELLSGL